MPSANFSNSVRWFAVCAGLITLAWLQGCATTANRPPLVAKWERFERVWESSVAYANPPQEATLTATFTSPIGEKFAVYGFWDGGRTWRLRFAPNLAGQWSYTTTCSDTANTGLHHQSGAFICTAPSGKDRFTRHGPVRVSHNGRHLEHEDGTPFFWLGDTAWCGPLLSNREEWDLYLRERARQKFTAVQWVATQFRAAPDGDRNHQLAYTGPNPITINPVFFQRLDEKLEALNRAGLLGVPVLLWAINGGSNPQVNPGVSLPDDQAVLLARYMVARWQANAVVWILNGDGDYRGPNAERWRKIGRAVFGDIAHAPVTLHPGGRQWVLEEFRNEKWFDLCGYQSGHNETDANLRWITAGPPASEWRKNPPRPFLSLEAPYENHHGADGKPMSAEVVRRAHYWSLLNAPSVGVTYGGHGVWGWDDGTKPPIDHPQTGVPLPWQKALRMPGAEQMTYLHDFFTSIDFWRLVPASVLVVNNPGRQEGRRYIACARTETRDLTIVYVPVDRTVELLMEALPPAPNVSWFNPRTGQRSPAVAVVSGNTVQFPTPDPGDWVLVMTKGGN